MQQIILGSTSPRRKEILSYFGIPFTQASPNFDEDSIPFEDPPEAFACRLSLGKAESLSILHPNALIITADTIVYKDGKIYGKPIDRADALSILKDLSGKWHTVYTGITVGSSKNFISQAEGTRVLFNNLNESEINKYLNTIQYLDKAGSYAIQKEGGLIINKIDGCFFNVMGLPINTLRSLLLKMGVDLWQFLK